MRPGRDLATGVSIWVLAAALATGGQTVAPGTHTLIAKPDKALVPSTGEALREIDDPNTGDRWLLEPSRANPGGPGRLIRVASALTRPTAIPAQPMQAKSVPVLHSGDRLIVEERTPRVEARLLATALGAAAAGSALNVRLAIGGRVVRALAVAPGRALLQPAAEARP
jgi:hypothetical protein